MKRSKTQKPEMKRPESKSYELFSQYPDVLNVHQLREALGIGRKAAYNLIADKKIKAFMVGDAYKIPKTALLEYVEKSVKEREQK